MKHPHALARLLAGLIPCLTLLFPTLGRAGNYTNFDVAIYIPVGVVQRFENLETLTNDWNRIRRQLKVDKVYIEVQRNRNLASDALLEQVKKFFLDRGVRVAGGMALSDGGGGGQFRSFCYTDPADRAVRQAGRGTGRAAFRRSHPGRFLFRHHQERFGHRRQGHEQLDAVPAQT